MTNDRVTIQVETEREVIESVYDMPVIPRVGDHIRLTDFLGSKEILGSDKYFGRRLLVKQVVFEYLLLKRSACVVHVIVSED